MGRLLADLKDRREFDLLNAVASGRISVAELYDAHVDNALGSLRERLTSARIEDFLDPWLAWKRGEGMCDASVTLYRQRMIKLLSPPNAPAVVYTHELDKGRIIDLLAALDVTSGTRRQYLAELRSLCDYLVDKQVLRVNWAEVVRSPKKNAPRRVWGKVSDDQHIVACADANYQAVLAFAHATGADRGTLLTLRIRDVDFDRSTVDLEGTKTSARRRFDVPIESWAIPYLREACADRAPEELVFPGLSGDAISRAHDRATKRAGIENYRLKDGRHSYAIRAILAGHHLRDVSRWLGHANLHTTYTIYVHFDGEVQRRLEGEI
jgi:integrase